MLWAYVPRNEIVDDLADRFQASAPVIAYIKDIAFGTLRFKS